MWREFKTSFLFIQFRKNPHLSDTAIIFTYKKKTHWISVGERNARTYTDIFTCEHGFAYHFFSLPTYAPLKKKKVTISLIRQRQFDGTRAHWDKAVFFFQSLISRALGVFDQSKLIAARGKRREEETREEGGGKSGTPERNYGVIENTFNVADREFRV